jgi:ribulose-5-phosphate 4-epimerase/fuculose-1-phosphate aldolase
VATDLAGVLQQPTQHQPSSDLQLHLLVYRERADVAAIVHTHSPYATAWSCTHQPLTPLTDEMEYLEIGEVRTARYQPRGTAELGRSAARALGTSRAVLLERHGVVAVGATPRRALDAAVAVEHQACVSWLLRGARE